MSSGADLFVVCKQCGSEVSPYITECPYCGHRLRRRAPKLPRANAPTRSARGGTRLHRFWAARRSARRRARDAARATRAASRWAAERPYATIALVFASCAAWVLWHAKPDLYVNMAILGPLHGDWWKLFTTSSRTSTACTRSWRCWRWRSSAGCSSAATGRRSCWRCSSAPARAARWWRARCTPTRSSAAPTRRPWRCWRRGRCPTCEAARTDEYYEGDLLGAAAIAALLLAMPFARPEASWLAGIVGGALGLLVGFGLHSLRGQDA